MSRSEAQRKAQERYSKKLSYVQLKFTPEEAELLARVKAEAEKHGGLNAYIKGLLEEDLRGKA